MIDNKSGKDLEPCIKCGEYMFKINYEECMRCRYYG
jgi:hypothetical protein